MTQIINKEILYQNDITVCAGRHPYSHLPSVVWIVDYETECMWADTPTNRFAAIRFAKTIEQSIEYAKDEN
jgi:hypothetical protein